MGETTYRISTNRMATVTIAAVITLAGVFYQASGHGRDPEAGSAAVFVVAVPLAIIVVWAWRMRTLVRPGYLGTRGLLRTRKMSWRDIQDIRIERNETNIVKENAPVECVRVYLSNGKKITLPHLNQKNLNGHRLVLAEEVARIRDLWVAGRGDGWQVVPAVQREAAQRARLGGKAPWAVGMAWAVTTFLILAVLNVVALAIFQETGHVASTPVALLWVSPMVVVPLVAFIVGTVKAKRRVSSTVVEFEQPDDGKLNPVDIAQEGRTTFTEPPGFR